MQNLEKSLRSSGWILHITYAEKGKQFCTYVSPPHMERSGIKAQGVFELACLHSIWFLYIHHSMFLRVKSYCFLSFLHYPAYLLCIISLGGKWSAEYSQENISQASNEVSQQYSDQNRVGWVGGLWEGFSGFVPQFVLIVFSNVVMNFIPYTLSHIPYIIHLVLMVLIWCSTMCSEDLPHVLLLSDLPCILFPIASHFNVCPKTYSLT